MQLRILAVQECGRTADALTHRTSRVITENPLGHAARLGGALGFDLDLEDRFQRARNWLDGLHHEMGPDSAIRTNRRRKSNPIQAIIYRHADTASDFQNLPDEATQQ